MLLLTVYVNCLPYWNPGESRKTVTDSKKKVKEFLGRINTLIARQMGVEGTTESRRRP